MRPTLRQLQYVVAVADAGKFGVAARNLSISQPSLSTMIADMETELGVVLFERGRQGALLTPAGTELVRRARGILTEVENLKAVAGMQKNVLTGRIRLGVLPSIGPYLLPSAVRTLHGKFPDLRLFVREERTLDLDANLREGRFDTIISSVSDHPSASAARLFEESLYICVAPDHPLALGKGQVALDDLAGHEILSLGYGFGLNVIAGDLATRAGAVLSSEYEGTSLDAVRQMAAMGAGVAILPSLYATTEARRDPDLIIRRINHPAARREVSLIWRETSTLVDSLTQLAAVLKNEADTVLAGETQMAPGHT